MRGFSIPAFALLTVLSGANAAMAASCQPPGGFDQWLQAFKSEAAAKGISPRAVTALDGVTPDPQVIRLDRSQRVFKQSFEQFASQRIASRLGRGQRMMSQHAALLARIEQRMGVPGSVVVAIWGLETDFGTNMGKQPVLRSLATLAHDCRRTQMFQAELLDALRIVQRGDLTPAEMLGAWAGELGQTQFLPSSYMKFAIDFDGNGKRDLIRSVPDVLGSTGNYLRGYGWQRGGRWSEGSQNFEVLKQWNKSSVYQRTIALFATRLSGER